MVFRTFFTPTGKETRELTQEELESFANSGDPECRKELSKQELKELSTSEQKIDLILDHLGLK